MANYFLNNQKIRHDIRKNNDIWIGTYDITNNTINHNGISYNSPSGFAMAHYRSLKINRTSANGWCECEYQNNELWISLNNLDKNTTIALEYVVTPKSDKIIVKGRSAKNDFDELDEM
jgi:hypothetical protein